MPYSVPPSPPPVINLPLAEEVQAPATSSNSIFVTSVTPATHDKPEFSSAFRLASAEVEPQACGSGEPACRASASENLAIGAEVEPASVETAPRSNSPANPLGQPLEVNSAIAQPESFPSVQYGTAVIPNLPTSAPAATLPLPGEVNVLAEPFTTPPANEQPQTAQPFSTWQPSANRWQAKTSLPEIDTLVREIAPPISNRPLEIRASLRAQPSVSRRIAQTSGSTPDESEAEVGAEGQLEGQPTDTTPGSSENGASGDSAPNGNAESLPFPPPSDSSEPTDSAPTESLPSLPTNGSDSVPTTPQPDGEVLTIPGQTDEPASGQTPPQPTAPGSNPPPDPAAETEVIELNADRQEYEQQQQVFRAQGNAVMRFRQAVLSADRIQVNIPNRIAVAEGNVVLTRGQQVLKGQRFEYNFVQGDGTIFAAAGELNVPAASDDFSDAPPPPLGTTIIPGQTVATQVTGAQPPFQVLGSPGGITFGVSGGNQTNVRGVGGDINRIRYEAERVDFTSDGGLVATNVRLTNDPFSPPELEIRSPRVTYTRLSETRSELRARNPRVVFDQGFSLPLLRNRVVFDSRERNPSLVQFGFDEKDRGGFYLERSFDVLATPAIRFTLTPQLLVQRAYDQGNFFDGSSYGLRAQLDATLSPTTALSGDAVFTSLDLSELENNFRGSLRATQAIGTPIGTHRLALEYSYRDRLFNGSLGFQNVQSSLGFVLTSPQLTLGNTGIVLNYQVGAQFINAATDRQDLLPPILERTNNRTDLTRYQASATLGRTFYLWVGKPLPPTATEGLRYTPNPVLPYVAVGTIVRGVFSAYSNGDSQSSLLGGVSLVGQFGHFSRPFFDYTAFQVAYSRTALDGKSPFLFDRVADEQILTLGITQQLIGPFRLGLQTSINLDTSRTIDTIYSLEYSRRTYSLSVNFSPVRESASLTLRISDFNWLGDPGPFSGIEAAPVSDGVRQPTSSF